MNVALWDGEFAFPNLLRRFDFILAQSVFTHLPLNALRHCLARLDAHLEGAATFAFTIFTPEDGTGPADPSAQRDGIVTHPHRDPFHYTRDDLSHAARGLRWMSSCRGISIIRAIRSWSWRGSARRADDAAGPPPQASIAARASRSRAKSSPAW